MSEDEKKELLEKIDLALDNVRPHLKVDDGNVEVVDITGDMILQIKWLGNCENCFMSTMTMKAGIEQEVKQKFPQIKSVEALNGVNV